MVSPFPPLILQEAEWRAPARGVYSREQMAGRIERALEAGLRIRPGEQRRVALMSLYAANAIGAVVVGHSVRDALYLANRPARGLAGMYIWSSSCAGAPSRLRASCARSNWSPPWWSSSSAARPRWRRPARCPDSARG